jgi:K+-sensing histidine kinase KdpD
MNSIRQYRDTLVLVGAVVVPLGLAALLAPFRADFANSASALILLAVVLAVAVAGQRIAGYVATVSSCLWFDFFLTRPYDRLAITHRPDIETAVSLFVVGIVVTELAARNRHHHQAATAESDYVGLIYRLSELSASGAPAHEVTDQARLELIELLHLRACRYEAGAPTRPMHRIEHDGTVILGGALWSVEQMGLPGPELELVVQDRGTTRGRFVLTPSPGVPVTHKRRLVAVALADQVGAALAPRLRSA